MIGALCFKAASKNERKTVMCVCVCVERERYSPFGNANYNSHDDGLPLLVYRSSNRRDHVGSLIMQAKVNPLLSHQHRDQYLSCERV